MTTFNDAAVEAAARAIYALDPWDYQREHQTLTLTWDELLDEEPDHAAAIIEQAEAALTAALPHLRKEWEAPVRELLDEWEKPEFLLPGTTTGTTFLMPTWRLRDLLAPEVTK